MDLHAYSLVDNPLPIRPAVLRRAWMDTSINRFAYRCLPLAIANQMGWEILSPATFTAKWNGKNHANAIKIKFEGEPSSLVDSHFGEGVLTFIHGYLFRTPAAHNLWVKGPANSPKDGICALEGIVETDWAPFTFTMNWRFTRKRHKVRFEKGEPIATIFPYPRQYAEEFNPSIQDIEENPQLRDHHDRGR